MSSYQGSRAAIEAVATCAEAGAGSRALAVRAARAALDAAGRVPEEIELLINAGVYRDENIIEPAMGPFIQRGIDANSTFPPRREAGTFSFDLANGAGGVLTAIRVIDGFMRSGAVRSGMVVASDADPDPSTSERYSFAAAGGAILLRAATNDEGFAWFHARTWSEHFALYDARLGVADDTTIDITAGGARSQRLRVSRGDEFLDRCVDCACRTIDDVARSGTLDPSEVDLVIPAPNEAGFAEALAARLGWSAALAAPAVSGDASRTVHTAATAFALERAITDGRWARARRVLFVAAGAGITVSLALYQRGDQEAGGSARS